MRTTEAAEECRHIVGRTKAFGCMVAAVALPRVKLAHRANMTGRAVKVQRQLSVMPKIRTRKGHQELYRNDSRSGHSDGQEVWQLLRSKFAGRWSADRTDTLFVDGQLAIVSII